MTKEAQEQLDKLAEKEKQIRAKMKQIRARESEKERKARTRRLIKVGAALSSIFGGEVNEKTPENVPELVKAHKSEVEVKEAENAGGDVEEKTDAEKENGTPSETETAKEPPKKSAATKNKEQESDAPKCETCGATMVKKHGKKGDFWGCPKWTPQDQNHSSFAIGASDRHGDTSGEIPDSEIPF